MLVARVLRLPARESEEQKRIRALERQLATARQGAGRSRTLAGEVARLERALAGARQELAEALASASAEARRACERGGASEADRIVDAAIAAVAAKPPPGVDPAYLRGFAARNGTQLRAIVDSARRQSPTT